LVKKDLKSKGNSMKINHKLIRDIIKYTGFLIFLITVILKLRSLFIYGGTKVVTEVEGSDDEDESEPELQQTEPNEVPQSVGRFSEYVSKITKSPLKRI
jgi:hypothetical protein